MISATALKNGTTFTKDGKLFIVVKYSHSKIGRGGANVKLSIRNLQTGGLTEMTLNSNSKVDEIATSKQKLQYLYADSDTASFMNPRSFDQVEIPTKVVGDQIQFIKEGENVNVVFWEGKPLSVEIPDKVVLEVSDTSPGVKGNSATNIFKSATLSNGLDIKVPLFIKNGDHVRVDTKTSGYVERVSIN